MISLSLCILACLVWVAIDYFMLYPQRQIRDAEFALGISLPKNYENLKVDRKQYHAGAGYKIRFDMSSVEVDKLANSICRETDTDNQFTAVLILDNNPFGGNFIADSWWQPKPRGEFTGVTCGNDRFVNILVVNMETDMATVFISITIS